jgi:hypothetical protein
MRAALWASFAGLLLAGCAVSEAVDYDALPIMTGTGGSAGGTTGTVPGPAGATGSQAGSTGSQAGFTGGQAGSTGSQAGSTGSQAGSTGSQGGSTGNQGGSTGTRDAGAPDGGSGVIDAGATDGGAVTFTQLYTTMFNNPAYASNCTGGGCHNPGTQKGLDFSTQAKGYTTAFAKVKAGVPASSKLYTVMMSGSMPQARPKIPAADLAKVASWINAGALNN